MITVSYLRVSTPPRKGQEESTPRPTPMGQEHSTPRRQFTSLLRTTNLVMAKSDRGNSLQS